MPLKSKLALIILPLVLLPSIILGVTFLYFVENPQVFIQHILSLKGFVVLFLVSMALITIYLVRVAAQMIQEPLYQVLKMVRKIASGEREVAHSSDHTVYEISELSDSIVRLQGDLKKYEEDLKDKAKLDLYMKIGSQVSHDIQSPLSVLKSIVEEQNGLKEQDRVMLRMAVNSINDIANDLSSRSIEQLSSPNHDQNQSMLIGQQHKLLLRALVDALVSKKRIEYKTSKDIVIEAVFSKKSYSAFVNVNATSFKRVLSNLINNSIEAFKGVGRVEVVVTVENNKAYISVKDNGCGIPQEFQSQIFERGQSFGKKNDSNSGLGLFHAKQTIESWNGAIHVDSKVNVGTELTLELPLSEPPAWFVQHIDIRKTREFVIVDDDQSIHHIWKSRFNKIGVHPHQIIHFASSNGFEDWVLNQDLSKDYLFLFDQELIGSNKTGLDLILEYKLQNSSVLVTSRYEEDEIRQKCEQYKIKLLPKSLAPSVPLEKQSLIEQTVECVDCVLVDDNALVRMNWEGHAAEAGQKIFTFETTHELFDHLKWCGPKTKFYLDQNLKDGTLGLNVARQLKNKGYKELYIASAFDAEDLNLPDGLVKGCVGKKPPFNNQGNSNLV